MYLILIKKLIDSQNIVKPDNFINKVLINDLITAGNAKSEYATYLEEIDARQDAAKELLQRKGLPGLLIRTYQRLHKLQEISELSHRQMCANSH